MTGGEVSEDAADVVPAEVASDAGDVGSEDGGGGGEAAAAAVVADVSATVVVSAASVVTVASGSDEASVTASGVASEV